MTFNELMRTSGGITAVIDGCGDSAEIGLYKSGADAFDEPVLLDWPDDWPSWITVKKLRELGVEVITV